MAISYAPHWVFVTISSLLAYIRASSQPVAETVFSRRGGLTALTFLLLPFPFPFDSLGPTLMKAEWCTLTHNCANRRALFNRFSYAV